MVPAQRQLPGTVADTWERGIDMTKRRRFPSYRTASENFAARYEIADDGCWNWIGGTNGKDYGVFNWRGKTSPAHRWGWRLFVGPVPDDWHVDHLCRNPRCVNPDHLEPVPAAENQRRRIPATGSRSGQGKKTHCKRGHPFDGANTLLNSQGRRVCRLCRQMQKAARGSVLEQERALAERPR